MDITTIVELVIKLIVAIIIAFVIPLIKSKTNASQLAIAKIMVKAAVEAAEQIFGEGGTGEQKKAYVLNYLNDLGIKLDADSLEVMIEAAVLEMDKALFGE